MSSPCEKQEESQVWSWGTYFRDRRLRSSDAKYPPRIGDSLQDMGASVFKGKAGTDNEVLYCCGDEHLSGFGHGANTSTDVHSYSSKIATPDFTNSPL